MNLGCGWRPWEWEQSEDKDQLLCVTKTVMLMLEYIFVKNTKF